MSDMGRRFKETGFCQDCGMAVAFSFEGEDGTVKQGRMKEHPVEHCLIYLKCEVQTYKSVLATAHEIQERIIRDYERLLLQHRELRDAHERATR